MLRILALEERVGVGKDEYAVVPLDDARLPAGVAGQTRMSCGMDIARAYALVHLEARSDGYVPSSRRAPAQRTGNHGRGERGQGFGRGGRGLPSPELFAR